MTKRENLLALLRREPFEEIPVDFGLCPDLEKEYRKRTGSGLPYHRYFGMPWENVEDIRLEYDPEVYRKYYPEGLKEGTQIDVWGVAHEPEMAAWVLDRVTEQAIVRARSFAKAGVDILYVGDDVGMQKGPMMSLEMYETWLKPRLARVISAAKEIDSKILIFYHSCGDATQFIPDLIDCGVDVLNPIQSECMDFGEIYRKCGGKISFHGTIGTQTTMPFGTPEEVKEAVWKNLDMAAERGGLFVAPTHLLEPEVPWENIMAYVEACREYTGRMRRPG